MKAEHLVVLASASTVAGAIVQQKVNIPVVSQNKWYEAALGVAVAAIGAFVVKKDGISDVIIAGGLGFAAGAVVG